MTDRTCCKDDGKPTRHQASGLGELSYRIGTWSSFRRAMIDRLSIQPVPPDDGSADASRPLAALTTRSTEDGSIALIDAWACACDVLTFYQERILNEGYLPTAVHDRSVREIARSIGYEPDPGVAATTSLAFTIDESYADGYALVPAGLAVLSVPEDDELPQRFETSGELEAWADWNVLTPRTTQVHEVGIGTQELYLEGVDTRLEVGAAIVLVGDERAEGSQADASERWDLRFVASVETADDATYTRIGLDRPLGEGTTAPAQENARAVAFRDRAGLFGWNAPDVRVVSETIQENSELVDYAGAASDKGGDSFDPNKCTWRSFSPLSVDKTRVELDSKAVDLDREYPSIVQGGWVLLQDSAEVELYAVERVVPASRTEFSLNAKVTRVYVDSDEHLGRFKRRKTAVLIESDELALAEKPNPDPIEGTLVELNELVDHLPEGRKVLVSGVTVDDGELEVIETSIVDCTDADERTTLELADALPQLERDTVEIYGNVVDATHGESVSEEVLGSGDSSASHQEFTLTQRPLTWVPSVYGGSDSTLELRVGGILWERVDDLYDAGPRDRVYTLRLDADGNTVVGFGDGERGARLPTGVENVVATYRKGIGLDGEVAANQLQLLQSRPLGVLAVDNPRQATGAADADDYEDTRANAPLTVLTLDRLVALQDYEDYARAFPGIGKAKGVELWDGKRGFVHVTIASESGAELADSDATIESLVASYAQYQDPAHHAVVKGHVTKTFGVELDVLVDSAYEEESVKTAVAAAIEAAFSFAERDFGQVVAASEVVHVAQNVEGVVAVDLERLYRSDVTDVDDEPLLPAAAASWDGTETTKAELLVVDPDSIVIGLLEDA